MINRGVPVSAPRPRLTDATEAELNALQSLGLESGYDCVYAKKGAWQAKVPAPYGKLTLGTYPTPRLAATAVAVWLRGAFGPRWPDVYRRRHEPGWAVEPVERGGAAEWVAKVWEDGVLRVLFPDGGAVGWPTRAAAEAAVRGHLWDRFGLFAGVVARRGGPCGFLKPPG